MIRLLETQGGSVMPSSRDAVRWHRALTDEIGRHLSPEHARLLARPEPVAGGLAWVADGTARTRYADLPADGRRALDVALGAILSDIRRLAESGASPAVREAWPALREVPDMGHVFAVDGGPVLAGWGHGGDGAASGRLARFDDGVRWRAAPRAPWRTYGAVLGTVVLLALAAGLLLPSLAARFVGAPPACAAVPGQLQAMRDQAAQESRGAELQTLLASLTDEAGRRQLQCPIPVAPAAPTPAPVPAPRPAPPPPHADMPPHADLPPRADLPQTRWDRRDLSMLAGCWRLDTGLSVSDRNHDHSSRVRLWQMCFDEHGSGQQTESVEDGRQCAGPLSASFAPDGRLLVTEPEPCQGTLHMVPSTRLCRRTSDREAQCDGVNRGSPEGQRDYEGIFRR